MAEFLGLLAFSALIAGQFLSMAVAYEYQRQPAESLSARRPAMPSGLAHDRA